jgi:membrane protein DedA with SNARE-associated domain
VQLDSLSHLLTHLILTLRTGQLPELGRWTYFLLFLLVAIEGPIAILLASAAASAGLMRPVLVFIVAALGNLTADSGWYMLGYLGKTEWIQAIGRRLGIRPSLIEHLKSNMIKHATRVLFMAKLTISFVIPSLIAAGLLRIPWKRWFPYFIVAEALWTGSLVLIGYYTTEALKRVEQGVEYAVLAISLVFVGFMILAGRRLLRQLDKDESGLS